ncbi:MAG: hypothetical protein SFY66_22135 [Oculatellaceae cyanobacterium bins.114]|nr:hypothetical protein [Oculatellaceae cyanobacterium bins.114]
MRNESLLTRQLARSATPVEMPSVITPCSTSDQTSRLQSLWQWMSLWFQPNHELRVWQERDRRGNWLWCAYHPLTDQEVAFPTEEQLRQWIENPISRDREPLHQGLDD